MNYYASQRPPYPDTVEQLRAEIDRLNAKLFRDAERRAEQAAAHNLNFRSIKGSCQALAEKLAELNTKYETALEMLRGAGEVQGQYLKQIAELEKKIRDYTCPF